MRLIKINICGGRQGDFCAEYILNEDGERILDALIALDWWMSFGDIRGKHSDVTLKVGESEVTREDVTPEKAAAYITLYGALDSAKPWRHIHGDIDPLGFAHDDMLFDEGIKRIENESMVDYMLRAFDEVFR